MNYDFFSIVKTLLESLRDISNRSTVEYRHN